MLLKHIDYFVVEFCMHTFVILSVEAIDTVEHCACMLCLFRRNAKRRSKNWQRREPRRSGGEGGKEGGSEEGGEGCEEAGGEGNGGIGVTNASQKFNIALVWLLRRSASIEFE